MKKHTYKTIFSRGEVLSLKAQIKGDSEEARILKTEARKIRAFEKKERRATGMTDPNWRLLDEANSLQWKSSDGSYRRRCRLLAYGFVRNKTLRSMEAYTNKTPSPAVIAKYLPPIRFEARTDKLDIMPIIKRWLNAKTLTLDDLLGENNVAEQVIWAEESFANAEKLHQWDQRRYSQAQKALETAQRGLQQAEDALISSNGMMKEALEVLNDARVRMAKENEETQEVAA